MIYNEGELEMLREFILLPIVLTVLERDKKVIEKSELKTKYPYIEAINTAMRRITKELGKINEQMQRKNLRVPKQVQTDFGIECIFWRKGQTDIFQMNWDLVRAETEIRMIAYITGGNDHS
jgi:hypothetical protein